MILWPMWWLLWWAVVGGALGYWFAFWLWLTACHLSERACTWVYPKAPPNDRRDRWEVVGCGGVCGCPGNSEVRSGGGGRSCNNEVHLCISTLGSVV